MRKRRTIDKGQIRVICPECKAEQDSSSLDAYGGGGGCSCCSEPAEWTFSCSVCGAESD